MAKRTVGGIVEIIIDRLIGYRSNGILFQKDFTPLITLMLLVADEIDVENLVKPKGQQVWQMVVQAFQEDHMGLSHNSFLPCHCCDQAVQPVIDDTLFRLFLRWYQARNWRNLVALHQCPKCGGEVRPKKTRTYEGDTYTPPPGSVKNGREWAKRLLELRLSE